MKTKVIPVLIAGTVSLTQVAAAAADRVDFNALIQDAYRQLSGILNEEIASDYDPEVAAIVQGTVNNALGVLGFPAPYQVTEDLENRLAALPQPDITEPVPASQEAFVRRDLNRDLLRQQIDTVLGEDGQITIDDKTEDIAQIVSESQQHAERAETAISTQASIKQMAQQQARSAELLGALHTETIQSRQDTAAQSLALVDISESLDQQLTTRQAERRGEVISGLEQAAVSRLF